MCSALSYSVNVINTHTFISLVQHGLAISGCLIYLKGERNGNYKQLKKMFMEKAPFQDVKCIKYIVLSHIFVDQLVING